jgi:hypothetical protein
VLLRHADQSDRSLERRPRRNCRCPLLKASRSEEAGQRPAKVSRWLHIKKGNGVVHSWVAGIAAIRGRLPRVNTGSSIRQAGHGQDPPVALIKCLPRSGRSHCNQGGSGGRISGLLGSALGLISGDRHLQPRSFPRCRCYPTRAALEVIVQPHRRIMRARIGKAGFFPTGRALHCGGPQQEARRWCLRASSESVGRLLNVTRQRESVVFVQVKRIRHQNILCSTMRAAI